MFEESRKHGFFFRSPFEQSSKHVRGWAPSWVLGLALSVFHGCFVPMVHPILDVKATRVAHPGCPSSYFSGHRSKYQGNKLKESRQKDQLHGHRSENLGNNFSHQVIVRPIKATRSRNQGNTASFWLVVRAIKAMLWGAGSFTGLGACLVGARWLRRLYGPPNIYVKAMRNRTHVFYQASFQVIVQKMKATCSRNQGNWACFKVVVRQIQATLLVIRSSFHK